MMKAKKIITVALVGALSLGAFSAYAQMPKSTVTGDKVVIQVSNTREAKLKEIAVNAFKTYFKDEVNPQDLNVRVAEFENQKAYLLTWDDKESYRLALINDENDKILHLQSTYGTPENEDYKAYSSDDAKAVAVNFIKENNILGEDYTLSQVRGKEMNENKDFLDYFFYFQYGENKECLVTVNKEYKKVNQFILFDEHNGPKKQDKVTKKDKIVKKEEINKKDLINKKDKKINKQNEEIKIDKNKIKEIAKDAFKKYFDVEIGIENMGIEATGYNDERAYDVFYTDGKRNSAAFITADYELLHLESNTGRPKGEDYQKYTYDEAKTVATNFVKETNLLGENYTFLGNRDEEMKAMNEQKQAGSFYFVFQYDKDKKATIVVDKENQIVEKFLLQY